MKNESERAMIDQTLQSKSVRVRIAVGEDADGKYWAWGSKVGDETDESRMDHLRDADYEPVCFVEADIPERVLPTLEGVVSEKRSGVSYK